MVVAGSECDNCMTVRQVENEGVAAQVSQIESEDEYNMDWIEEDEEMMQPLQEYVQQEARSIAGLEKKLEKATRGVSTMSNFIWSTFSTTFIYKMSENRWTDTERLLEL